MLKDYGVEPIDALDQEFDPNYHQAPLKQPSDEHPAGRGIAEAARGYKMHDRVLRPAPVLVPRGPAVTPATDPRIG